MTDQLTFVSKMKWNQSELEFNLYSCFNIFRRETDKESFCTLLEIRFIYLSLNLITGKLDIFQNHNKGDLKQSGFVSDGEEMSRIYFKDISLD